MIAKFVKHLKLERGYSENTRESYKRDVQEFLDTLEKDPQEACELDVSRHLSDLILERELAPSTRNRTLYSIKAYYKFLLRRGLVESNPCENIDPMKTSQKAEPRHLKKEEIQKLLSTVESSEKSTAARDYSIITMFLYCGLRVGELVSLNRRDYNDQSLKFTGKGEKERIVPVHSAAQKALRAYLRGRRDKQDPLYLSTHKNRISPRSVQRMVKSYGQECGISGLHPHVLRHSFASMFYKNTKDLKILQELLGHSNLNTTQIYTHTDNSERKQAVESLPEW